MRRHDTRRMAAVAKSKYWREEDATVALDALADSGQTLTDFARHWGVCDRRLRRWQQRLGRDEPRGPRHNALVPTFRPVEIVVEDGSGASSGVEVVLPTGHRVAVQRGFDREVFEEVLHVLDSRC